MKDQELQFLLVPLPQLFAISNYKIASTIIGYDSVNGEVPWQLLNLGCSI